jgi:hypothetical protein
VLQLQNYLYIFIQACCGLINSHEATASETNFLSFENQFDKCVSKTLESSGLAASQSVSQEDASILAAFDSLSLKDLPVTESQAEISQKSSSTTDPSTFAKCNFLLQQLAIIRRDFPGAKSVVFSQWSFE